MTAVRLLEVPYAPSITHDAEGDPLMTRRQLGYLRVRRPFEVVASAILVVLCLPLIAVLALAIMIDSPGSPIFTQQRIGRNGRTFTIYKLRSMSREAPRYMSKVASDDHLVTRVGGLLRLSGLDELPQLFNVIRGDLNLIGPRPEMPFIVARFQPWQHRRHELRPGITGWWQIHHRSGDPLHLAIEDDLYYARNLSLALDLRIVVATTLVMVRGATDAIRRGLPSMLPRVAPFGAVDRAPLPTVVED